MGNQHTSESSSDVRKTRFTILKEQQCSLNMQIRLAMELHNAQYFIKDCDMCISDVISALTDFYKEYGSILQLCSFVLSS